MVIARNSKETLTGSPPQKRSQNLGDFNKHLHQNLREKWNFCYERANILRRFTKIFRKFTII